MFEEHIFADRYDFPSKGIAQRVSYFIFKIASFVKFKILSQCCNLKIVSVYGFYSMYLEEIFFYKVPSSHLHEEVSMLDAVFA